MVNRSCLTDPIGVTFGGVTFTVRGPFSGTVQFEASADGNACPDGVSCWVALLVTPSNSTTAVTSAVLALVNTSVTFQANVAGYTNVRLRVSAYTSGSAIATISTSSASARVLTPPPAAGGVTSIAGTGPITTTPNPITGVGTVNCPTCVTSAAPLTNQAAVVGRGGQAVATIPVDNIPTHALFATAGDPAFRAIVAGDLPAGPASCPGGSNTQVQYNSAGACAGSPNLTFNGTTLTAAFDALIHTLTIGLGGGSVSSNTAVGFSALGSNTSGSSNVAVGLNALGFNTTGVANTAIGGGALFSNVTGTGNSALGAGADVGSGALIFATAIGANAVVSTSNTVQLGRISGADQVTIPGVINLPGITSGVAQLGVAPVAGTPARINLPTASGTSGQFLQTDGGSPQQTSWTTPSTVATSVPFSGITSGTNTTAAMVLGTGSSLTTSGTGTLSSTSGFTSNTYSTATNCADSAGAAACGSAAAGAVVVDAGATTVTVSTTAVTANSEILVHFAPDESARLGITCNATVTLPTVTAKTAATSFVITIPATPVTNPACYDYVIFN